MSFGWSAGDVLAACILIKDVVNSLSEASGARSSFQALAKELLALERAFMQVHVYCQTQDNQAGACAPLLASTQACKDVVDRFLASISKSQPYLANKAKGQGACFAVQSAVAKISWSLCTEKQVGRFRTELNAYATSIGILLAALQA